MCVVALSPKSKNSRYAKISITCRRRSDEAEIVPRLGPADVGLRHVPSITCYCHTLEVIPFASLSDAWRYIAAALEFI